MAQVLGKAGILEVDGKLLESHPMPRSLPITLPWDETFNVGPDTAPQWTTRTIRQYTPSAALHAVPTD